MRTFIAHKSTLFCLPAFASTDRTTDYLPVQTNKRNADVVWCLWELDGRTFIVMLVGTPAHNKPGYQQLQEARKLFLK